VAARLVREAKADGMVSAGNTGAVMTVARFLLGTLESGGSRGAGRPFSERPRAAFLCCSTSAQTWIRNPSTWFSSRSWEEVYYQRDVWQQAAARSGLLSVVGRRDQGQRIDTRGLHPAEEESRALVGNVEGGDLFQESSMSS